MTNVNFIFYNIISMDFDNSLLFFSVSEMEEA